MARYRLNAPAFFQKVKIVGLGSREDYLAEAGVEVEVPDNFPAADHLEPLDDPARKAAKKWEDDKAQAERINMAYRQRALADMTAVGPVHMQPA